MSEEYMKDLGRAMGRVRRKYCTLRSGEMEGCHLSFAAAAALKYGDDYLRSREWGVFGVEGCNEPSFLYINTGETYTPTVIGYPNCWGEYKFTVSTFGDFIERKEKES